MQPPAITQVTTISASTAETTIVTGISGVSLLLLGLVITSTDAAASTLTLRDATAGTTRAILDYPNAAVAPGSPLIINFPAPMINAPGANWTIQASVNAGAYHVTAFYQPL